MIRRTKNLSPVPKFSVYTQNNKVLIIIITNDNNHNNDTNREGSGADEKDPEVDKEDVKDKEEVSCEDAITILYTE